MAVVACASRFAVLKLEDDEISESLKKNNHPVTQSGKNKMNQKGASTETKSKPKKKKKNANEIAELQSLAFGTQTSKKQKSFNNCKSSQPSAKQWEEWKQKDSMIVSEAYEQDLQEALLMSKIDYEEKKDVYDALQKESDLNKLGLQKKKKKNNQKKDKGIMSLDEFQTLDSNNKLASSKDFEDLELPLKSTQLEDAHFFDKIEEDAEKIITKEHKQDKHKPVDPVEESARFHQYQEDLKLKDKEISVLKENVAKLKEELKNVKLRNKKLLGILECGEMREKAEILVQIDQLLAVKDELTEQVSEYHTSLEQERSKVHALQMELKKCQNSKKQRTESK